MQFTVWIEPHERQDALEAYEDRLSEQQKSEIEEAPEEALICLTVNSTGTHIRIVEEG